MTEVSKRFIGSLDSAFEENNLMKWDYYHEVIGEFAKSEHNVGNIASK